MTWSPPPYKEPKPDEIDLLLVQVKATKEKLELSQIMAITGPILRARTKTRVESVIDAA
jgi:hypothetical protein